MAINVLTQPYRRPGLAAQDNYLTTLDRAFDLQAAVRQHGAGQVSLTAYLRAHPTGRSEIWAVNNNRTGRSVWHATRPNDLVLFYGHGEVYAYGIVSSKVYWPANNFVWPSGTDWDYIYSLRDLQSLPPGNRPATADLRTLLSNFVPQPAQLHDTTALGTSAAAVFTRLFPVATWPTSPTPTAATTPPPLPRRPRTGRPPLPESGPIGRSGPGAQFTGLAPAVGAVIPNWQARERGTLAHQQVILQLEQLITAAGHTPRYGVPGLNFDISWTDPHTTYLVEVKSLTADNEADQIRLGLGQVLDYRWTFTDARPHTPVTAVLVTEQAPRDPRWVHVCAAAGVLLTWPDRMAADLRL